MLGETTHFFPLGLGLREGFGCFGGRSSDAAPPAVRKILASVADVKIAVFLRKNNDFQEF